MFGPQKKIVWTAKEIAEVRAVQKELYDYMMSHGKLELPEEPEHE